MPVTRKLISESVVNGQWSMRDDAFSFSDLRSESIVSSWLCVHCWGGGCPLVWRIEFPSEILCANFEHPNGSLFLLFNSHLHSELWGMMNTWCECGISIFEFAAKFWISVQILGLIRVFLYFYCLLHTFIMSSGGVGMVYLWITPLHNTFTGGLRVHLPKLKQRGRVLWKCCWWFLKQ